MVLNRNKLNTKSGHVPTQDFYNMTDASNTVSPVSDVPPRPESSL